MSLFDDARGLYERAIEGRADEADVRAAADWPAKRLSVLFAATDQIRRHFFADAIEPCAIMNIKSGGCSEDCAFCSQSVHNSADVAVQALSAPEKILAAYRQASARGLAFGVVSSGRKLSPSEIRRLAHTLARCDGPVHASLGLCDAAELRMLREAGVVCYNHNIETSREFFPRIVSSHGFDQRIETVRRAREAGMRVCCGGIFGMGESWDDRVSMARELRALDVDTVPLNFLNAIPGTRLDAPGDRALDFLKIIALFRIALPDKRIKVCGGREVNLGALQPLMFYAGANGYISGDYLTTAGDPVESDDRMIAALGLRKQR
jgi:biotin synthase